MKVLVELRPALEGHAGIPQEARLLFRAIGQIEGVEVQGLIQTSDRFLPPGLPREIGLPQSLSINEQIDRLSRLVVALQPPVVGRRLTFVKRSINILRRIVNPAWLLISSLMGASQKLSWFDPQHFRDFVWRGFFSKSLPVEDFDQVTQAKFRVAQAPYGYMHMCGLATAPLGRAIYPVLDAEGIDAMLVMTPYPAVVSKGTQLIVRYFDAVPLLMPHTIINKEHHQALHYQALRSNVASGAYFACCSDATRRDLLAVFPELKDRAITIPCMLSHDYFYEESARERVPEILAKRRNVSVYENLSSTNHASLDVLCVMTTAVDYLLMVSTLEPRKNHGTLLEAWEFLRSERYPSLKLVVVGSLGWEHEAIIQRMDTWIRQGDVILLSSVPANELRLLYRHAQATVCPSFAEGFGYAGVEAMRCGGIVVASDIAVHREVYGDAAEYFNPYSAEEAAGTIGQVIDPMNLLRRIELITAGARTSARFMPDIVAPQWISLISNIKSALTQKDPKQANRAA